MKVISDYWIERSRLSAGYPIMVPVVDLVEIGNGGGQHRLGRRVRKAPRRAEVGRRRSRACRLRARWDGGDDDRREPRARPDQPRLLLRRRDRSGHGRGRPGARRGRGAARRRSCNRGAGHRQDREQQHDQRAEADLAQPRLRPPRFHARRLRRRRRDARGRARGRARDPQGRRSHVPPMCSRRGGC